MSDSGSSVATNFSVSSPFNFDINDILSFNEEISNRYERYAPNCDVPCLKTIEELKEDCKRLDLSLNGYTLKATTRVKEIKEPYKVGLNGYRLKGTTRVKKISEPYKVGDHMLKWNDAVYQENLFDSGSVNNILPFNAENSNNYDEYAPNCNVPCLKNIEELSKDCSHLDLDLNGSKPLLKETSRPKKIKKTYEVDIIWDHKPKGNDIESKPLLKETRSKKINTYDADVILNHKPKGDDVESKPLRKETIRSKKIKTYDVDLTLDHKPKGDDVESKPLLKETTWPKKIKTYDVDLTLDHKSKGDDVESKPLLKKTARSKKIKKTYEVDLILDHKPKGDDVEYLVKWKNFELSENTWEPSSHLQGCPNLLALYKIVKKESTQIPPKIVTFFINDVIDRKPLDLLTLKNLLAICHDGKNFDVSNLTVPEMKKEVKSFHFPSSSERLLEIMIESHKRQKVLINLKEWEEEVNRCNTNSPYITVENDVDLEEAPTDFQFIPDYMPTSVVIPTDPLIGCNCEDCYDNKQNCCPKISYAAFPYTHNGTVKLQPGFPIYECNKRCSCGPECKNRVVQHGSKVKLAIFRTSNGCGWGLKTLENLKKNQFVIEYFGEVISQAEADLRGKVYNSIGRSYLFDLGFEVEHCSFAIDAAHLGNASHFMNHSCNPNVYVFAVWVNQLNPHLPRLAFFAKRNIKCGEELTFDYKGKAPNAEESTSDILSQIPCKCGSKNCRKFL